MKAARDFLPAAVRRMPSRYGNISSLGTPEQAAGSRRRLLCVQVAAEVREGISSCLICHFTSCMRAIQRSLTPRYHQISAASAITAVHAGLFSAADRRVRRHHAFSFFAEVRAAGRAPAAHHYARLEGTARLRLSRHCRLSTDSHADEIAAALPVTSSFYSRSLQNSFTYLSRRRRHICCSCFEFFQRVLWRHAFARIFLHILPPCCCHTREATRCLRRDILDIAAACSLRFSYYSTLFSRHAAFAFFFFFAFFTQIAAPRAPLSLRGIHFMSMPFPSSDVVVRHICFFSSVMFAFVSCDLFEHFHFRVVTMVS